MKTIEELKRNLEITIWPQIIALKSEGLNLKQVESNEKISTELNLSIDEGYDKLEFLKELYDLHTNEQIVYKIENHLLKIKAPANFKKGDPLKEIAKSILNEFEKSWNASVISHSPSLEALNTDKEGNKWLTIQITLEFKFNNHTSKWKQ